jgi:hypothetical protein
LAASHRQLALLVIYLERDHQVIAAKVATTLVEVRSLQSSDIPRRIIDQ